MNNSSFQNGNNYYDLNFFLHIIKKYNLYPSIKDFLNDNGYYMNESTALTNWKKNMSPKAISIIKKDLEIYKLTNNIDISIEKELKEFKNAIH